MTYYAIQIPNGKYYNFIENDWQYDLESSCLLENKKIANFIIKDLKEQNFECELKIICDD